MVGNDAGWTWMTGAGLLGGCGRGGLGSGGLGDLVSGQEVVLVAGVDEAVHGEGDQKDGDQDRDQPDLRVDDFPDPVVAFRWLVVEDVLEHDVNLVVALLLGVVVDAFEQGFPGEILDVGYWGVSL
jgi:hypothetical protein